MSGCLKCKKGYITSIPKQWPSYEDHQLIIVPTGCAGAENTEIILSWEDDKGKVHCFSFEIEGDLNG